MAIDYRKCPRCETRKAIPIVYGLPAPELMDDYENEKVELGGCCIWDGQPGYFCKSCENKWSKQEAEEAAYKAIKILKAFLGGYFGGYYDVEIDFESRQLNWKHSLEDQDQVFNEHLSVSTVNNLREELRFIKLLNWKSRYEDPGIIDGTQWQVEMIRNGRTIRKRGSNAYPNEWDQFCRIIEQVAGKSFR